MKALNLLVPVFAIVSLFAAPGAVAGVVYSQPADFPASSGCPCWTSDYGSDIAGGFQNFDDFNLAAAANINQIAWQGFYTDFINPSNNPVPPDTNTWVVQFWSDSAGLPGSVLFTQDVSPADVVTTFVGQRITATSASNVYDFSTTLPVGFSAANGTTYWFSILSEQSTYNPIFVWTRGAGGDNLSEQASFGSPGFVTHGSDMAFDLGTAPEPGAFYTSGVLLLGIGALRRRNRRQRAMPGESSPNPLPQIQFSSRA